MQEYKLNKVTRYTNDKNGQPLKTKDGRPYTRLNVQVAEYGDKWLSGFDNKETANWKEGDVVKMTVKQNGEYLNFDTPKKDDEVNQKLEQILNKLTGFGLQLEMIKEAVGVKKEVTPPSPMTSIAPNGEQIDTKDIPF